MAVTRQSSSSHDSIRIIITSARGPPTQTRRYDYHLVLQAVHTWWKWMNRIATELQVSSPLLHGMLGLAREFAAHTPVKPA